MRKQKRNKSHQTFTKNHYFETTICLDIWLAAICVKIKQKQTHNKNKNHNKITQYTEGMCGDERREGKIEQT